MFENENKLIKGKRTLQCQSDELRQNVKSIGNEISFIRCCYVIKNMSPPPLSNTHLRTPRGFKELLTYLTREILRSQPVNIYEFCLTICQQLYGSISFFSFNLRVVYIRINERNNGILSHELVNLDSTIHSHENKSVDQNGN